MNTLRLLFISLSAMLVSLQAQANDFEAALSTDTAQLTFRSDSSLIGWGGSDLALSLFYNEADDFMAQAELLQVKQPSSQNPLTVGIGVKAYAGRIDFNGDEVFAFGIGGEVRYTIAATMPSSFYLRAFIAPEITSFSNTEGITDLTFGAQIEVLPQTIAFLGLRVLEVDNDNVDDYEFDDDEVHFGVRLTF